MLVFPVFVFTLPVEAISSYLGIFSSITLPVFGFWFNISPFASCISSSVLFQKHHVSKRTNNNKSITFNCFFINLFLQNKIHYNDT
ncbi:MAG: hypothetical protein LBQ59_04240 [Candidatus Peribacteria bacterium]|nr:hypothetical protein [Candidatus Peribacteria bacterium]